jgi:hypothetical protein
MLDKYAEAVERFGNKYSHYKGVISIEPDDFGADIIIVLIDDLRYKNLDLPESFADFTVSTVKVYELRDAYEQIVNSYVENDPSIWDVDSRVPFKLSLDKLEDIISDYEEKIDLSIENSFRRIKETLAYVNRHLPVPAPVKKKK